MEVSHIGALERVARVLAGMRLSINGEGEGRSVADKVDLDWPRHLKQAEAVLNVLREPDARMASVGDAEIWTRMVRAALGEEVAPPGEPTSWAVESEIYQKPLG